MAKAETAVYGGVQAAFTSNKALAKAVAASVFPDEGVRLPINFHGEHIHYRQAGWEGRGQCRQQ
jgi:hypothetical protein